MQGHPEVIDCLKALLRGELTARDQYFLHSRIYEDQGLVRLYERMDHEMQEETQHADAILRRILLLGGPGRGHGGELQLVELVYGWGTEHRRLLSSH